MNLSPSIDIRPTGRAAERGSVLVIVLLITFGLISLALYFANSMTMELRAADNRTSGLSADQAIEGAARYVSYILTLYATNGAVPDPSLYQAQAVPVGNATAPEQNAHFWLIGRDPSGEASSQPYFALVDEASKLDLNAPWLTADVLATNLPRMTYDFADAIMDWRNTNGTGTSLNYSQYGYLAKHAPFETVDELRLVYGSTVEILAGEDINRNGILDPNEPDLNGNGQCDPGVLEYFTVYSRQPNVHSDGTSLTNINNAQDLQGLLEDRLGSRGDTIYAALTGGGGGGGFGGGGFGGGQAGSGGGGATLQFTSVLDFYLQSLSAGMTEEDFAQIYNDVTVTNSPYTIGRVDINTAPAAVLACLPGMDIDLAQQVVNYRTANAANLTTIAWIVDALGASSEALQTLAQGDYITTQSYQFTADVAAVGPFGRGYRRVKLVFDVSDGTPKIIYRQDLSRLGWALGTQTRDNWVTQNSR